MVANARSSERTAVARSAASSGVITSCRTGHGGATVAENLALRCRTHNLDEAEEYFGN